MAESSFGIGILGAASIAKKNARAIAKCRNGTGDRTALMQQRLQLCLFACMNCRFGPICKYTTYKQAVSIWSTVSPYCCSACTALDIERTALE